MNRKLLVNVILQLCVWLFIFIFVCYFHPTNEVMTCNKDKICSVKHEFLYKFSSINTFVINNSTQIRKNIKIAPGGRSNAGSYRLSILYDNVKPFIYYNAYNKFDDNELSIEFDKEKDKFSSYIKNPKQEYTVTSAASFGDLNIFLIFYFVLFFIWLYVIYVIIDVNNKEKKSNN